MSEPDFWANQWPCTGCGRRHAIEYACDDDVVDFGGLDGLQAYLAVTDHPSVAPDR